MQDAFSFSFQLPSTILYKYVSCWDLEQTFSANLWPGVHEGSRSLWGVAWMSSKQPLGKYIGRKCSLLKTIQVWLDNNGV